MHEIICPHCKKAFKIDDAGYADILKQVRDGEFEQIKATGSESKRQNQSDRVTKRQGHTKRQKRQQEATARSDRVKEATGSGLSLSHPPC